MQNCELMSIEQILSRIKEAETAANRLTGSTCVIAVSKLQPLDRIQALLDAGHRCYGENRVQEALSKWHVLKEQFPRTELHLLGPLQTNKVRQAMSLFHVIHSIDRSNLVNRIARIADELGHCPQLFIQVNTGEEPQKSGVMHDMVDQLVKEVRSLNLPLLGLMCIPPIDEIPALHFGLLRSIANRNGLSGLSMGMSADFETAIKLGATHVRIGTAIFGSRDISLR